MKPIIYQLLPRLFTNYNETRLRNGSRLENGCGTMQAITPKALKSIRDLGATHVWYTGVIRHATAEYNTPSITKGRAGSPYAITDYYDIDPDIAANPSKRMAEFEALVERTHKAGLQVIIDFVPNHVSREYHSTCKPRTVKDLGQGDHPEWAFSPLNNFYYLPSEEFQPPIPPKEGEPAYHEFPAKATGNDCFTARPSKDDWFETVKLNYGVFYQGGGEKQFNPRPKTWDQMTAILLFWAKKGVDAFRVDMAEMVPHEFWTYAIGKVKHTFPKVQFLAECYNPALYRTYLASGFDYLYDKVGMYEYLRGVTSKNWAAEGITQHWMATDDIRDKMLYFLENHDEQRIASGFFCGRGICAEPAMIVAACLGTNPLLIYSGQELGETGMDAEGFSGIDGRTTIFDYWGVKSLQAWANDGKFDGARMSDEQKNLRQFYRSLMLLARDNKAITNGLMFDIEYAQSGSFNKHEQYAFLRHYKATDIFDPEETLLVVCNFDDKDVEVDINVPQEAWDYFQTTPPQLNGKMQFIDLLTGKKYPSYNHLKLPAWTGVVLRLSAN